MNLEKNEKDYAIRALHIFASILSNLKKSFQINQCDLKDDN
jgi:hypothetical protein